MKFSDLDMDLLLSEPRMDTYREAAVRACPSLGKAPIELLSESEGELEFHRKLEIAAARLYFWNSFVSGALWPWISFVEVIVRNSINDHLCAYFDVSPVDGWHTLVRDGENFVKNSKEGDFLKTRYLLLTSRDYEAFKTKLNEVKRRKRTDSITGDIFVGKVSLGIWISLLNEGSSAPGKGFLNYEQTLWQPCLKEAFPNFNGRRAQLRDKLNRFARLRNRIAHHEHLLGKNIANELDNLIEIAGYVDSDAAQLISEKNMVEVALSKKSEFLHGGTIL